MAGQLSNAARRLGARAGAWKKDGFRTALRWLGSSRFRRGSLRASTR